jgi:hypothetical protein
LQRKFEKSNKKSDLSTDDIVLFELASVPKTEPGESSLPHLVWAEVNVLALPFAVLNENEARTSPGYELIKIEKKDGKQIAIRWAVWPYPKLGMPTMTSLRVLFVLMQKAADEKKSLGYVPEKLKIGSLSDLCRLLGMPADGYSRKTIKRHLEILVATQCMSKGAFKNKQREGLFIDSFKYLRSVGFVGDFDDEGNEIEENYVVFDEPVRRNLDAKYVKQIDLALMKSISCPIGQLLYTKLSHLFNDADGKPVSVTYQWLAETMGIKLYERLSDAKQQLKQAIETLVRVCYIENPIWSDDGKIVFTPGVRYSFGEELPRQDRKKAAKRPSKTNRQSRQPVAPPLSLKEPVDLLFPICSVFAQCGWEAVKATALRRGAWFLNTRYALSGAVCHHFLSEPCIETEKCKC